MRRWFALALLLSGCSPDTAPELSAIDPSTVTNTVSSRATLRGQNLGAAASLSIDNSEPAQISTDWKVRIGPTELQTADVTPMSTEAIAIVIPAGLPVGVHDVVATSPVGQVALLSQALTVIAPSPASCGNGACDPGETPCGCPADCGASICGDGVCCTAAGENRCVCAADCGDSTCGDGCCSSAELANSLCKQDCSCATSCDQGCGGAGCCTTTCTTSPCRPICGCATCGIDCGGVDVCTAVCEGARSCALDCKQVNDCNLRCLAGATCHLRCGKNNSCALECNASTCDVTCRNGNSCNQVRCINGAHCLLHCQAANNCNFAECTGGMSSCPGKIVVCNRACP